MYLHVLATVCSVDHGCGKAEPAQGWPTDESGSEDIYTYVGLIMDHRSDSVHDGEGWLEQLMAGLPGVLGGAARSLRESWWASAAGCACPVIAGHRASSAPCMRAAAVSVSHATALHTIAGISEVSRRYDDLWCRAVHVRESMGYLEIEYSWYLEIEAGQAPAQALRMHGSWDCSGAFENVVEGRPRDCGWPRGPGGRGREGTACRRLVSEIWRRRHASECK